MLRLRCKLRKRRVEDENLANEAGRGDQEIDEETRQRNARLAEMRRNRGGEREDREALRRVAHMSIIDRY